MSNTINRKDKQETGNENRELPEIENYQIYLLIIREILFIQLLTGNLILVI